MKTNDYILRFGSNFGQCIRGKIYKIQKRIESSNIFLGEDIALFKNDLSRYDITQFVLILEY